jgi:hypothetical protein
VSSATKVGQISSNLVYASGGAWTAHLLNDLAA